MDKQGTCTDSGDPFFIWEPVKAKKGDIDHYCTSPEFLKLCNSVTRDHGTEDVPAFPYATRVSSDGVAMTPKISVVPVYGKCMNASVEFQKKPENGFSYGITAPFHRSVLEASDYDQSKVSRLIFQQSMSIIFEQFFDLQDTGFYVYNLIVVRDGEKVVIPKAKIVPVLVRYPADLVELWSLLGVVPKGNFSNIKLIAHKDTFHRPDLYDSEEFTERTDALHLEIILEHERLMKLGWGNITAAKEHLQKHGLTGVVSFLCRNKYYSSQGQTSGGDILHQMHLGLPCKIQKAMCAPSSFFGGEELRRDINNWMLIHKKYGFPGLPKHHKLMVSKQMTGKERRWLMEAVPYLCYLQPDNNALMQLCKLTVLNIKFLDSVEATEHTEESFKIFKEREQEFMEFCDYFFNDPECWDEVPSGFKTELPNINFPKHANTLEYYKQWHLIGRTSLLDTSDFEMNMKGYHAAWKLCNHQSKTAHLQLYSSGQRTMYLNACYKRMKEEKKEQAALSDGEEEEEYMPQNKKPRPSYYQLVSAYDYTDEAMYVNIIASKTPYISYYISYRKARSITYAKIDKALPETESKTILLHCPEFVAIPNLILNSDLFVGALPVKLVLCKKFYVSESLHHVKSCLIGISEVKNDFVKVYMGEGQRTEYMQVRGCFKYFSTKNDIITNTYKLCILGKWCEVLPERDMTEAKILGWEKPPERKKLPERLFTNAAKCHYQFIGINEIIEKLIVLPKPYFDPYDVGVRDDGDIDVLHRKMWTIERGAAQNGEH